jgi:hypothetical protein
MADIQALEQRFEAITVQDENQDSNAFQHKAKVCDTLNHLLPELQLTDLTRALLARPSHYRISELLLVQVA